MRKLFAIFAALMLVTVQVIDLAIHDAAHADMSVAHSATGGNPGGPEPCDGDGEADCAFHCPCYVLHHAFAGIEVADIGFRVYAAAGAEIRHNLGTGLAHQPPIPPPLT